jgi:carbon starvation protein
MLFITVACGAVSGFHALVATGTTTKQISSERDAKRIGYNAMLLESTLSLCVILALGSSLLFSDYKDIVWPTDPAVKSNPILAFSLAIGSLLQKSFSIPTALGAIFGILLVEGFVITTLDAAVRINRYLFEELWNIVFKGKIPALLRHYWFNSGLAVILMFILAFFNAFSTLWPIFGTGNQLLAALSLIAISVWLTNAGKSSLMNLLSGEKVKVEEQLFSTLSTTTRSITMKNKEKNNKGGTRSAEGEALQRLPPIVALLRT